VRRQNQPSGGYGCSITFAGGTTASATHFVYIFFDFNGANRPVGVAGNLYAYQVSPNGSGAPTEVPGSPFSVGTNATVARVDPLSRFLFLLENISGSGSDYSLSIDAYTIDAISGVVAPVSGSPFMTSITAAASSVSINPRILIDPSGSFLYVAVNTTLTSGMLDFGIYGYSISSSSGALQRLPNPPYTGSPANVNNCALDAAGSYLYATINAQGGATNFLAYAINATSGALSAPNPYEVGPPGNDGLSTIAAVDPAGLFIIFLWSSYSGPPPYSLWSYPLAQNGEPTGVSRWVPNVATPAAAMPASPLFLLQ
jgi:hypothetical protein